MIYICGDSFCVSDPEYGDNWADILSQRFDVCNLAQVAASNLLIAKQVHKAIEQKASFVIMQCTAVTRSEKRVNNQYVPFSYNSASKTTTPFTDNQLRIIKDYYTEFFDLDLAVFQNRIIIEHSLRNLVDSGIDFRFDQGGFEHPRFGNVKAGYFEQFDQYRSSINLWNYTMTRDYRPYYHIVDPAVHHAVADYYSQQIIQYQ